MPATLLIGEDEFLQNLRILSLKRQLGVNSSSFNYQEFEGKTPVSAVFSAISTPSFDGKEKLVVHRRSTLVAPMEGKDFELLSQMSIPDSCHLVLSLSKMDRRVKAAKFWEKIAKIEHYPTLDPWETMEMKQRVQKLAQHFGISISDAVCGAIVLRTGGDGASIWQAIQLLELYADGKELTTAHVKAVVSISSQSLMEFYRAVALGSVEAVEALYVSLIETGEHPQRILATTATLLRQWLSVKAGAAASKTNLEIARLIGGKPGRVFYLSKEVEPMSVDHLVFSLQRLKDWAIALKNGKYFNIKMLCLKF
jgi:DNA polymerase-3 subunit delta